MKQYHIFLSIFIPQFVTACQNNTYGARCSESCGNCLEGEHCNHVNGTCYNGCEAGYYNLRCKTGILTGKYTLDKNYNSYQHHGNFQSRAELSLALRIVIKAYAISLLGFQLLESCE